MKTKSIDRPIKRSRLRSFLGMQYYGMLRKIFWIVKRNAFAKTFEKEVLQYPVFSHKTILRRKLKDVDMWLQENKIVNLKIASKTIDHITIQPGEVFSYWKLIGNPTKAKGYQKGMVLHNGTFTAGTGGGLCQLSNLLFWMVAHTPLTVVERHRHGYDVFPDANRTQPFGSGATCYYPHGDFMFQNNTNDTYQIILSMDEEYLLGEIRCSAAPNTHFEVVERNHEMKPEFWGGYGRYNEIYKQEFDENNHLMAEELLVKNAAIMMYAPLLPNQE